jgi:hypothetical protein
MLFRYGRLSETPSGAVDAMKSGIQLGFKFFKLRMAEYQKFETLSLGLTNLFNKGSIKGGTHSYHRR